VSEVVFVQTNATALADVGDGNASWQTVGRLGGMKVNQVTPPMYELAEAGRIYGANTGVVADGLAPVQEFVTTGAYAGVALYNGAAAGRGALSLVILAVGTYLNSATAVAIHSSLMGGIGKSAAALTTTSGNNLASLSGSTRTTVATLKSTPTLGTIGLTSATVLANYEWVTAASVGGGPFCHIPWGMLVVPPTYSFGAYVLASAGTTPMFGFSIVYAEVESYLV
jgi:hypothetical protein